MARFDKILVAVDFSEHSAAALDCAIDVARSFGARLELLHCYHVHPGGISPYGVVLPPNYYSDIRDAAARQLQECEERVSKQGVEVSANLSSDYPSEAIARAAEELGADLIVMGTRGLSGIKHVVLGSVAERTVRTAPCPVLTVKGPES